MRKVKGCLDANAINPETTEIDVTRRRPALSARLRHASDNTCVGWSGLMCKPSRKGDAPIFFFYAKRLREMFASCFLRGRRLNYDHGRQKSRSLTTVTLPIDKTTSKQSSVEPVGHSKTSLRQFAHPNSGALLSLQDDPFWDSKGKKKKPEQIPGNDYSISHTKQPGLLGQWMVQLP